VDPPRVPAHDPAHRAPDEARHGDLRAHQGPGLRQDPGRGTARRS
jgi:hypothetical protein